MDRDELNALRSRIRSKEYGPRDLKKALYTLQSRDWDPFVERLFGIETPSYIEWPDSTDVIPYLPSPVEAILDLVETMTEQDVLYDLGAGLGKVILLAGWLSGAKARGVELVQAYVDRINLRASDLGMAEVSAICADVRDVDFSDGTLFYFYDPFRGELLDGIVTKIEELKTARIAALGHTCRLLEARPTLELVETKPSRLRIFRSRL